MAILAVWRDRHVANPAHARSHITPAWKRPEMTGEAGAVDLGTLGRRPSHRDGVWAPDV